MDKTLNKVRKYILEQNLISKGDEIVIGVSGGADSVCLFTILCELKEEFSLSLKVVHINHLVRPDASLDALYVKSLCEKENIPFFLYEKDVEAIAKSLHLSVEDAGRKIRYEAFNEVLGDSGKIAVAHNSNDKVETFFLNLFRGSGLNGLCSIKSKRDNIIRPILCLSRNEIEKFLEDRNIRFQTDSTNKESIYTRNKIRNNLIPYVENEINKSSVENVSSAISILEETNEFLNKFVSSFISNNVTIYKDLIEVDLDEFKKEESIIKKLILLNLTSHFIPGNKDISSKNIEDILNILDKSGKKEITLSNDLKCVKEFRLLKLYRSSFEDESEEIPLDSLESNFFSLKIIENRNLDLSNNSDVKYFDFEKISSLCIRKIKDNDFIFLNGNKKSLREVFNAYKLKGNELLLCDGSEVIWIVNSRINEHFKVSSSTKKVLKVTKKC